MTVEDMAPAVSCPAKAGHPVNHRTREPARPRLKRRPVITGLPAFAGNDSGGHGASRVMPREGARLSGSILVDGVHGMDSSAFRAIRNVRDTERRPCHAAPE